MTEMLGGDSVDEDSTCRQKGDVMGTHLLSASLYVLAHSLHFGEEELVSDGKYTRQLGIGVDGATHFPEVFKIEFTQIRHFEFVSHAKQ